MQVAAGKPQIQTTMAHTFGLVLLMIHLLTLAAGSNPSSIPPKKYLPFPWRPVTIIHYPRPYPSIIPAGGYWPLPSVPSLYPTIIQPGSYWPPPSVPLPKPFMEELCARKGGQCVRLGECPKGTDQLEQGLCPLQPGVECCYGACIPVPCPDGCVIETIVSTGCPKCNCLRTVTPPPDETPLLSSETLSRRTVARFTKGSEENKICWDRHGVDGFFSVIDTHNHFRPFGGPAVPFKDYIGWMIDSGIVFSTVFGIGQLLIKKNPHDPDCCYYLHCPNLDYVVTPNPTNDILNAEKYRDIYMKDDEMKKKMHLIVSATSLNLQNPVNNINVLNNLTTTFSNVFSWAGEINIFKHALAANGFFMGPRVTVKQIKSGALDPFFNAMETVQWPVTLHCDLGCDQYDSVPLSEDNPLKGCEVPESEMTLATKTHIWWKTFLGPYYVSFFNANNRPRDNFKKIQHLQVWDTILTRFPNMKVVWAHLGGLSKELKALHPVIHKYILMNLFDKHPNLYADISWDILAKLLFLNYQDEKVDMLLVDHHEDMKFWETSGAFNKDNATTYDILRKSLHDKYLEYKDQLHASGSKDFLSGPTHALAIYLDLINKYPERFLTGTDFVASMGKPEEYPGLKPKPTGCMKDRANHARQVTDTSSINIFLEDEPFKKIVLGENFFKLTGLDRKYATPPLC